MKTNAITDAMMPGSTMAPRENAALLRKCRVEHTAFSVKLRHRFMELTSRTSVKDEVHHNYIKRSWRYIIKRKERRNSQQFATSSAQLMVPQVGSDSGSRLEMISVANHTRSWLETTTYNILLDSWRWWRIKRFDSSSPIFHEITPRKGSISNFARIDM